MNGRIFKSKLWPILAIRPKIGRKRPPMDRVDLFPCALTSVQSAHRRPFSSPLFFLRIMRKNQASPLKDK